MKLFLLLLAAGCTLAAAAVTGRTADMEFLHKQKRIYDLLLFVRQDMLLDAEFYDVGKNYDIEANMDMYKDKNIVQEFLYQYRHGMLPKNVIYSPYYEQHRYETKLLFKLFYYAKDFQTFYKTAAFARLNLNHGVFTSAFSVAVFFREDCKYMRLPAIYEIYPNLFYDSTVIQEAHRIKMSRGLTGAGMSNVDTYTIYANYTGTMLYDDMEYKMDYFMEDIGLNAFYYYVRQVLPFWLEELQQDMTLKNVRGDLYYYVHQQLIARYYLERISNGLGEIEDFDYYKTLFPGYYSTLMYSNGVMVPQRPRFREVPYYKYKYLKEIDILETRIMNAIDSGYVMDITGKQINIYTPEGMNILGNIIEGNVDSCNRRFYGMYDALARDILGYNMDYKMKNKAIPSALQCYSTSMRDPAFYRLYKKIMMYFFRYKKNLPMYKQSELNFPGVKIESVNIDKMMTYYDTCESVINNALAFDSFKEGMTLRMKARRHCLNYKPFTYRLNVNSDKETKAVLRIFLGPAYDEYDVNYMRKYYKYFFEMDKFIVNLRTGQNTIERRSGDAILTMPEMMPMDMFYKKLQKAISGGEPFTYFEKVYGFPERLTLPRGRTDGMKFKMYFILNQLDESKMVDFELPIFGKMMLDGKPCGFPLDRPMNPAKFYTPNMMMKDVMIYHMKDEKMMY